MGTVATQNRERVEAAARAFPRSWTPAVCWAGGERPRLLPRQSFVRVSPGSVQLGTRAVEGWELVDLEHDARVLELFDEAAALEPHAVQLAVTSAELLEFVTDEHGFLVDVLEVGYVEPSVQDRIDSLRALGRELAFGGGRKQAITEWSAKSRANMTRTIAQLDHGPMYDEGWEPALVTLTYPKDWVRVCPNGRVAKRQLKAFRSAVQRRYGRTVGMWKLEFQRRGAPHFHILLSLPAAKGPGERRAMFDWFGETWARIVGATGGDRAKHARAGVGIDWAEAARMRDPQRIAVYFSKHNAPGRSNKEYQHRVPRAFLEAEGEGPGRWWGVWTLKKCTADTVIERGDLVELARLLRGWVKGQRRTSSKHRPRAGGPRAQRRRWKVRPLGHADPAGFVLSNDAPALAAQLARAATLVDPEWPPGVPRGLP